MNGCCAGPKGCRRGLKRHLTLLSQGAIVEPCALFSCAFSSPSAPRPNGSDSSSNPKDDFLDSPGEHPLEYFTRFPLQHFAGDFCRRCSAEERLAAAQRAKVQAQVNRLGRVRDKEVLDVTFFDDGQKTPSWKSILVEKTPGKYYEIYQVEPNLGAVLPSYLIAPGPKDALIAAKDDCQRYGCTEEFFSIRPEGPVRLDFKLVFAAAAKACPRDRSVWRGYRDLHRALRRGIIRVGTTDPDWGKPTAEGVVEVRFTFRAGQFAIAGARYLPDVEYEW
jgi:hypothetical protein